MATHDRLSHNSGLHIHRRISWDVFEVIFGLLSFRDRIMASHVCRYWRDIFSSNPLLWSTLDLKDGDWMTSSSSYHGICRLQVIYSQRSSAASWTCWLSKSLWTAEFLPTQPP